VNALQRPPLSPPLLLSVVIPVYDEVRWVRETIRRVALSNRLGCEIEIVVVDDGSSDGTRELSRRSRVKRRT